MNDALGFLKSRLPQRETEETPRETFDPTPIMITPRTRLIVLFAVAVALIWLTVEAPSIPRLLMMGATIALVLSFPVRMLSRFMSRNLAILIVVGSMVALVLLSLILLVPFLISEIGRFVEGLPNTVTSLQDTMRDILADMYRRGWVKDTPDTVLNNFETNLFQRGQSITETLLNNTVETLTRSFSLLITAFGVFFIATYLLVDVPKFQESFVKMFASRYRNDARQLWDTLGDSLSRYLGGLLISITFQGVAAMIGLYLIGIPYALILGIWMAATAILPYIGAILGAVPAVLLAATMGWKITVATVLLYVVVNQVDGNFVTPRVQGSALRVHPVLIFVSVIGGGEIAGPFGAVMAVPTLAVIRVLAEFFWERLRVDDEEQEPLLVAMTGSELDIEVEMDEDVDGAPDETAHITVTVDPDTTPDKGLSPKSTPARITLRSAPNTPVDPLEEG
ncbi:MAG: AI-2E family transporter [Thermomicrobiales bacterium]